MLYSSLVALGEISTDTALVTEEVTVQNKLMFYHLKTRECLYKFIYIATQPL